MLRKIGIFNNEYDTVDAFLYGAKAAGLDVQLASVTGNFFSFVLVKPA